MPELQKQSAGGLLKEQMYCPAQQVAQHRRVSFDIMIPLQSELSTMRTVRRRGGGARRRARTGWR